MAIVTTADAYGNTTNHPVKDSVEDATIAVNNALVSNRPFIPFTGQDGKQFTLQAAEITAIKDE